MTVTIRPHRKYDLWEVVSDTSGVVLMSGIASERLAYTWAESQELMIRLTASRPSSSPSFRPYFSGTITVPSLWSLLP